MSTVRKTLTLADDLVGPSGVISAGGTLVGVKDGKKTALAPGEEKSSGASVGVVTLERRESPDVWYRMEKRGVAGAEEFVRREVLSSQVERKLGKLEGQLWEMIQEKAARDLTMEELRTAYGKPLLEIPVAWITAGVGLVSSAWGWQRGPWHASAPHPRGPSSRLLSTT